MKIFRIFKKQPAPAAPNLPDLPPAYETCPAADPRKDARLMLELTFWDLGAAKTLIGTMILYDPRRTEYWMIVESCSEILHAGKVDR